jgi:hypothetical protein
MMITNESNLLSECEFVQTQKARLTISYHWLGLSSEYNSKFWVEYMSIYFLSENKRKRERERERERESKSY